MVDIEQLAREGTLFDGRYKLLKTLSTDGGSADVWLAVDVNTIDNHDLLVSNKETAAFSSEESGMLVAIKIYRPKNALDIEGEQRFRDEYKIVHNCRHTNLLQPTNFSIFEETPYLELPYCKNGSSELLVGKSLMENELWKFIFDVASGLSYLHACNPPIVHQDIKPANVLIDDYNNYAITDFGISTQRGNNGGYYYDEDNSGTMAYMAPERFSEDYQPVMTSDIWAFGATLYEILTGEVPFGEEGGSNQLKEQKIKALGNKVPRDIHKLVMACLSLNPKDRPTANQIIKIASNHINRSNAFIKIAILGILFLLIVLAGNKLFETQDDTIPVEQAFNKALVMINSGNEDDVKTGLYIMDSLSMYEYVPAMYELARTYGWYSDSSVLSRKRVLGIEYYTDEQRKGMPVSDKFNDKARDLYSKILDVQDSSIAIIKANAAYRMATYSANTNDIYGKNYVKAKQYLIEAREYAKIGGDDSLVEKLNNSIEIIDENIKKDRENL